MGTQFSGNFNKRRSRQRDRLVIVAACAVAFSLLIVLLVIATKNKDQLVASGGAATSAEPVPTGPVMVSLVTAAQDITRGDSLGEVSLSEAMFPADEVPTGALTSTSGIEVLFADDNIPAGQPIVAMNLTKQKPPSTIRITPGMRAVTISVNSQSGLEGWAQPGTRVDVVLTFSEAGSLTSKVIVQNARVLSFGGSAEAGAPKKVGRRTRSVKSSQTITLEVSPGDALKVQTSRQLGTLSLLLRAPDDNKAAAVTEVNTEAIEGKKKEPAATKVCTKGTMKISGKDYLIDCDGSILRALDDDEKASE